MFWIAILYYTYSIKPECSKDEPGKKEGSGKAKEGVNPGEVKHRRKKVFQVSANQKYWIWERDKTIIKYMSMKISEDFEN